MNTGGSLIVNETTRLQALNVIASRDSERGVQFAVLAEDLALSKLATQKVLEDLIASGMVGYLSPRGVVHLTPMGMTYLQVEQRSGEPYQGVVHHKKLSRWLRGNSFELPGAPLPESVSYLQPLVRELDKCMSSLYPLSRYDEPSCWLGRLDVLYRLAQNQKIQFGPLIEELSDVRSVLSTES